MAKFIRDQSLLLLEKLNELDMDTAADMCERLHEDAETLWLAMRDQLGEITAPTGRCCLPSFHQTQAKKGTTDQDRRCLPARNAGTTSHDAGFLARNCEPVGSRNTGSGARTISADARPATSPPAIAPTISRVPATTAIRLS
jgi:hypothetical protein